MMSEKSDLMSVPQMMMKAESLTPALYYLVQKPYHYQKLKAGFHFHKMMDGHLVDWVN
jgi:hypothetical protein